MACLYPVVVYHDPCWRLPNSEAMVEQNTKLKHWDIEMRDTG